MPRTFQGSGKGRQHLWGHYMLFLKMLRSTKPRRGPYASGLPPGDSTPKSLSLFRESLQPPLQACHSLCCLGFWLHQAFWKPVSRTLPVALDAGFSISNLAPFPRPTRVAAPAPPGGPGRCGPRGAPQGSAPPRHRLPERPWRPRPDPGGGKGQEAGAMAALNPRWVASTFPPEGEGREPGWGAGLGAELTSKRAAGARRGARAGRAGQPGPRPSAAPTCGPGRAGPSELPARLPAAHRLCGRVGARPQPLLEEVSAGARPARTPPPAAPARGVRTPPPAPGPRG